MHTPNNIGGAAYINKQAGITGAAWNWENKQSAMNEAKKYCVRKNSGKAGQCEIANAFFNGCFALYWSPITKNYGWSIDPIYTHDARARGAQVCEEHGGVKCKEILTFCTTRIY